jgi:outer membrane protein assembly factor BamB/tRNA A-37 threonylcarbamoyl transferase component Bud32
MPLIKRGGATKGLGSANPEENQTQEESTSQEQKTRGGTTRNVGASKSGGQSAPDTESADSKTSSGEGATKQVGPAQRNASDGSTTRKAGAAGAGTGSSTKQVSAAQVAAGSGKASDNNTVQKDRGPSPDDTRRTKGRLNTSTPRTGLGTKHQVSSEDHVLAPNTVLQNRYAIEDVLGIGGMSVVYRGRDLRFKEVVRSCAIKEMYQRSPDSQTRMLSLQFFEREAGMLATLSHPAIPKVYDFFEENTHMYLVLELINGPDLETVLEHAEGPLKELDVGNWGVQICDVLSYLHGHEPEPIVFRDMKPSNIVLTDENRIVLVDFGIARLVDPTNRKGTMIGTEGYASPEQFRGIAGPASDIYSLGATLHQLLTGSDPRGETPFTFHERPIRALNPSVSPEMEAVITQALEYDIDARWSSAEEFKQALLSVPGIAGSLSKDGIVSSSGAPALLQSKATGTELAWKFTCEDEIRSSPCVNSGMLFVGCYDTNVYALDSQRGEFRWKYATQGGINSSPDVWQDIVLIGSEDGIVYALDVRSGKPRWKFRTEKAVRSSPRVLDRVIFVGSDDQHFYAIDGMRGTILWKYRTWMPIRGSACIGDTEVYFGGEDGNVYCLDIRNGGLRWKQRTQRPVRSTPVYSDGLVLVGSSDSNLYALDSQGGWPAWRFRTGHSVNSSPCVLGKRVFVGSADGILYAVDIKNGRLSWKFETGSQITSSPRADGGRIYFGAIDGCIYCLDAGTGSLIWKYQTEGAIVSSASIVDGIVYIGSMDHNIYALKA